ncbi:MAG: prepilin peptidase, partial [Syntrophomonas sp.]
MIFFILVTGLLIGSFINVIIFRLPRGESVVSPGSRCPDCQHSLNAQDLIPIFSYLWLKGKCRYCRHPISFRYPLVEIITAISFALIYLEYGFIFYTISGWLLSVILIASAVIDINEGIIPDK